MDVTSAAPEASIAYFPFPSKMLMEMRTLAAGLGTNGLADHADKIESGLTRMGDGMEAAGRSVRAGLVVVGIGIGIGLSVMGAGMVLRAWLGDACERDCDRRRRRRRRRMREWRELPSAGGWKNGKAHMEDFSSTSSGDDSGVGVKESRSLRSSAPAVNVESKGFTERRQPAT
ncbi:hypothetical protein HDU87_004921 [Geranomyces variabilis]|uniref:Uncharacterized protein n=1 Tax=Geranomyces variabilis TaxID=109894 RepID=A0AAD5TMX5_9FUNG|nr:hypothetical protein HDU87_004921 [Geranomyces variabilis]